MEVVSFLVVGSVVEVHEYRTSRVCPCCKETLEVVTKTTDGINYHEVRGLRRCNNTEDDTNVCSQAKHFVNRDDVGARNILSCFPHCNRPKQLIPTHVKENQVRS